ncbi:receptor protein-tyrosine kinase CEPR1 [Mercurialis annua]|uniref:receptor protein-tyrosine kinase CEPR1 n=1 Tax=Mercurialis annua TaxID=3986 RepID=UPI002160F3A2|nr:receptor protein-tyrosine kinase CEPR1 [Mercurialis annua]
MASKFVIFFLFLSLTSLPYPLEAVDTNQSHFFSLLKASLSGNALSDWEFSGGKSCCNFNGVTCNSQGYVEELDMSGWSVSGRFPDGICSYLPELRVIRLAHNRLSGDFLHSFVNCSFLEELNVSFLNLTGKLPDFSPLKSLRVLDVSYNVLGDFPMSVTHLTNLETLNFNENVELNLWQLPENISGLTKLKLMILTTCNLYGPIPATIGNMTSLIDLELSGNFLTGPIPPEIGLLKNLKQLELYYNYHLSGKIPEELGNLTELVDLDMSVNKLTGNIPESVCRLPKLEVLQLYNNSLTGEIPSAIAKSTTLRILSVYDNYLTGEVPKNLGQLSNMVVLDLSENRLSGPLPTEICNRGKLLYFLVLDNMFSGEIPDSYGKCKTLIRFRVSHNRLKGSIPDGLLGLPHVSIVDLSFNNLTGSIANTIGRARNLSELFLQSNKISGVLPLEISGAINLVKIDVSNNLLSGPVPSQFGYLTKLNLLMLQGNKLNSSIPNSLSFLKNLNVLDLSNNLLTGNVPESLSVLLPNFINFANNRLSGPIPLSLIKSGQLDSFSGNPGLCVPVYVSSGQNFPICSQKYNRKRLNSIWVIGISVVFLIIGALLFLKRKLSNDRLTELDETQSSSFFSYEMKSFHRISFNQQEILQGMIEKNRVGQGGSGMVYKIEFSTGEVVAVKRLWSKRSKESATDDELLPDKGLKAEVETLGSIRHKNIVKLYCYFSSFDCSLLVYEYMPNGNLRDALDNNWIHLDWPTRHQIALGVAQGLGYLHHDLLTPIIHRDIKSTNILLDINYQAKVADFGIAKILQARGKDSTSTLVAGTYGYIAPEYAYSSKATTKCDVYSFGVVLMELISGKKPIDESFGENKNIVNWVSTKLDTKEEVMEILDKRLSGSFRNEMIQLLRIAIRCTSKTPAPRPTMSEVVQLLIEADPCRFDSTKSSNKTKQMSNSTKINSKIEL